MGSLELTWSKYNRFAGVERTRGGKGSQTRCWVLRDRATVTSGHLDVGTTRHGEQAAQHRWYPPEC